MNTALAPGSDGESYKGRVARWEKTDFASEGSDIRYRFNSHYVEEGTWSRDITFVAFASDLQFKSRKPIPSAVRHQVWLREGGQCSWRHPDGVRCAEKKMLELEHIEMVWRGGSEELNNLTLRCRYHNQVQAEQILGFRYMEMKRHR